MINRQTETGFLLLIVTVAAALLCAAPVRGAEPVSYDRFGGRLTGQFAPGQCFRIEQEGGRWWFVTPAGGAFLSFGVNHVTPTGDRAKDSDRKPYLDAILAKYGTKEKWAEAACTRLKQWHFNTTGAWSQPEVKDYLPRTPILHLSQSHWGKCWEQGKVPDFFGPDFLQYVAERAKGVDEHAGDPLVIGYFIDNELPWAPDHRDTPELFDGYVAMPADAPGKQKLLEFFKERYETVAAFNTAWQPTIEDWSKLAATFRLSDRDKIRAKADREAFTLLVARQYFKATTDVIHARDPGRLVLGCRFMPYIVPKAVVQACGEYCDVISINFYEQLWGAKVYFGFKPASVDRMPQGMDLRAFYEVGQKPLMVTEFTSRAKDSGVPNTWPPPYAIQPVVKTQTDRAAKFDEQVMSWLPQPWFVGAHWFEHADQPNEGRAGDGENSNFGLVNIKDEPYQAFVSGVADTIVKAWEAHAAASEDARP